MAGLVPAISLGAHGALLVGIAGTSPAMTSEDGALYANFYNEPLRGLSDDASGNTLAGIRASRSLSRQDRLYRGRHAADRNHRYHRAAREPLPRAIHSRQP